MRISIWLASLALIYGGLTSWANAAPPAGRATTKAAFDCSPSNLSRWGERLQVACRSDLPEVELVATAPGSEPPVRALLVVVTKFSVRVGADVLYGEPEEVRRRLEKAVAHQKAVLREVNSMRGLSNTSSHVVSLAVAPDAPMSRVKSVLSVLVAHGFADVQFLFDAGPPSFAGLDPGAVAEVEKILNGPRITHARKLSANIAGVARQCEPLTRTFASLAHVHPQERCRHLGQGVVDALRSCRCAGDPDRVLAAVLALGGPLAGFSRITFGKGRRLEVDPGMSWGDAAAVWKAASGQTISVSW